MVADITRQVSARMKLQLECWDGVVVCNESGHIAVRDLETYQVGFIVKDSGGGNRL